MGAAARPLGAAFCAAAAVVFGMMLASFPAGAYVVFNTAGGGVDHGYPLETLDVFVAGIGVSVPAGVLLGDAFVAAWCAHAVVFAVAAMGPRRTMLAELSCIMSGGRARGALGGGEGGRTNYMVAAIAWFAVLVAASAAIGAAQELAGVGIEPPPAGSDLERFLGITAAPLAEEIGFRVMLIGIPMYLFFSGAGASARSFLRALWHPRAELGARGSRAAAAMIVLTAALFGASHVASGDGWGAGKLAQATASGLILGWVYYRYGLAPALVVHWAANYFLYAHALLVAELASVTIGEAFSHPAMASLEALLVAAGALAAAFMAAQAAAARRAAREAGPGRDPGPEPAP